MYFSKSTGGFYTTEIHGINIPSDAVEITKEQHSLLIIGQSEGKRITSGSDGVPFLTNQPPLIVYVPDAVSFFQGCAALQAGGYLDPVEAYMTGPASAVEKLAWRTITEIRRNSPLTSKLAVMLGLTENQVDDLFILAATIEA